MQEHVNRNNSISYGFMSSLIDLLPFRLRDTFLDKLACEGLLNSKDNWLDELVKFVEKRVSILESGLTGNRNQGSTDKGVKSNKLCCAFSNEKSSDSSVSDGANNVFVTGKGDAEKSIQGDSGSGKCRVQGGLSSENCIFCSKSGHKIYNCYSFVAAPVEKRCKFATSNNLCCTCLRISHATNRYRFRSSPRGLQEKPPCPTVLL